ncbi:T9SS type A sorting domain-containing protein [Adhaeribacter sp. BT258]|uniref:T9SS type A sorting domain-containing protein n=1 Tax=Adhaeribacter terrigena TaxID=2793070 RepID=A0ABS1C170_9BACT|nr:T9SS type A sorting domain-containing protein [Adhaeribacter terrigena]MBK0402922.1 T9SS type A sorting domain-containing protein [Adhaeribacter terrigena]
MKLKNLLLATASGFFLFSGVSYAQSVSKYGCYTDEHTRELERQNPAYAQSRIALEQQIRQYIQQNPSARTNGTVLKVPVVVHVVTEKGFNGISKAQVLNGIQVLNEDFRRTNADKVNTRAIFAPYAADLEIEFVLARIDPQGQPTEGINRVTSHTANSPFTRNDVKIGAPAWPTDKYFNIWLVNSITSPPNSQILGYAQFPGMGAWNTYGLVMLHSQWGRTGMVPGATSNTDGRTATHEVGHCFNLWHTFQGQGQASGCQGADHNFNGDMVGDTPPSAYSTQGCSTTQNTCSLDTGTGSPYTTDVVDQVENYMSYDVCQNMFTEGQRVRAHAALSTVPTLQNLTSTNGASPSNAMVTGIDPNATVGPLVPQPYFAVYNNRICAGGSVTFKDESYNGNVTTWNWTFPGGTPATSTDQNPTVTYNTPGVYAVTLSSGNGTSSRSITKSAFIKVIPVTNIPSASNSITYQEGFEDASFPNNSFPTHANANSSWDLESNEVENPNNWVRYDQAAASGRYSLRLNNHPSVINEGITSTLFTPNIETSNLTTSVFASFKVAFAKRGTTSSPITPEETLRVSYSTDCGVNWTDRYYKAGNTLVTTSIVTNNFKPTAADWREERINIPAGNLDNTIMFKFETYSAGGNSLYIDDFKLFSLLGTNEEVALENNIKVYPNPVTMQTGINFDLKTPENVSVKIYDLIGNTIYKKENEKFSAGSHTIGLHDKMKNLSAGMYLVEMNLGDKVYNTKLIVQ